MTELLDFEGLHARLQGHVLRDLALRPECAKLADAIYQRGELSRGEAAVAMD